MLASTLVVTGSVAWLLLSRSVLLHVRTPRLAAA
jgi:hypothetical protein